MTTTGSGVGGNIGGPQIPLQNELEATAWTNVNKMALGIVRDSIEQAFTVMNPRYSVGYLGAFGYRSTSSNPLLDHPLENVRRSELTPPQTGDNSWVAAYENLVNQLPPDLLARFNSQASKPFDQRNSSFTALDNLFKTTAKILTQMQALSQPTPSGSLEETRTVLNLLLPFAALKGSITNGQELLNSAQNFVSAQGPNYRYFDAFSNLLNKFQGTLSILEGINANLGTAIDGQLSPQTIAAAAKASQQLGTLRSQLEKISLGNDLQMLLSTITTLETVATALSLPNTATASLFIAASTASLGLFAPDIASGILGPSYQTLLNNVNTGLIGSLIPANNKAGNEFLSLIIALSLSTFAGLGTIAYNSGLGLYPKNDPQALDAAHAFAFDIGLQLAVSSGFIESFYDEIIKVAGGSADAQRIGSSALAQLAHLIIILSGSAESNTNPAQLIEGEATYINQGILSASEVEKGAESEKTAPAAIAIQLATQALESQDYEGFLDAVNNMLESIGTSLDALKADTSQLNSNVGDIANVISMGNPNEQITSIVSTI
jgi:hypothetical protein